MAKIPKRLAGPVEITTGDGEVTLYTAPAGGALIRIIHVLADGGDNSDFRLAVGAISSGTELFAGEQVNAGQARDFPQYLQLDEGDEIHVSVGNAAITFTLEGDLLDTTAPSGVRVATRVESADILALNSSPLTLVPGRANYTHVITGGWAMMRPGGTPYTVGGGFALILGPDPQTGSDGPCWILGSAILAETDQVIGGFEIAGFGSQALADVQGAPIELWIGTADPTAGDGFLDLVFYYLSIPTD